MKLEPGDLHDLKPAIVAIVRTVLAEIESADAMLGQRDAFTESEAAERLGVARHVLADARRRGEIRGRLLGKKIIYSREALREFANGGTP